MWLLRILVIELVSSNRLNHNKIRINNKHNPCKVFIRNWHKRWKIRKMKFTKCLKTICLLFKSLKLRMEVMPLRKINWILLRLVRCVTWILIIPIQAKYINQSQFTKPRTQLMKLLLNILKCTINRAWKAFIRWQKIMSINKI